MNEHQQIVIPYLSVFQGFLLFFPPRIGDIHSFEILCLLLRDTRPFAAKKLIYLERDVNVEIEPHYSLTADALSSLSS